MHLLIFGGTFNPVHYGHLRGAEEARVRLLADKVLFIPVSLPPHISGKDEGDIASPEARLSMLRYAIEGNPAFELSDMEIKRGGKSYTIDTIDEILGSFIDSPEITLVIGTDSFNELNLWHRYADILKLVDIAVICRPPERQESIEDVLPVELADSFCYDSKVGSFMGPEGRSIKFLDTERVDISSSMIREFVASGESVKHLTPDKVADYIDKNGLYRD